MNTFPASNVYDRTERDRRWSLIRRDLEKQGLDGLVVISDGQLERRGSFRHVSDVYSFLMWGFVVFPVKGNPVGIYPRGGWIDDRRSIPMRGSWVIDSEPYASIVIDVIRELSLDKGRIAIEGDFMPVPLYNQLAKHLPDATFTASTIVHELKMVKGEAEIKVIEKGVEMVDAAFDACMEYARVGRTSNDITSEVCRVLYRYGAEDIGGYPLDRLNDPIKIGDTYSLYPEAQAPGGHWMQFGRLISFGEPKKEIREAWELDIKAQQAGAEVLKPGNIGGDVMRAINEALKGSKYTGAPRGSGHAVGLDIIERPFLSLDDETVIKPGMIIAIHPVLFPHPEVFEACADMFVITEGKPRKLSRVSPEIKVIAR
jgi:Xaa-Pro aminopeptidase